MSAKQNLRNRAIACAALYVYLNPHKNERKLWVKKWRHNRDQYKHTLLLREFRENDPQDFKNYLWMDNVTFEHVLNLVSLHITKQDIVP
jgi:hypothetical protein